MTRLRFDPRPSIGDCVLDAAELHLGCTASELDLRLQLGRGLSILRACASRPFEPLALWHVDGAAYALPEPELVESPWSGDLPQRSWKGELGTLGNGDTVVEVRVELFASPAGYRFDFVTRSASGELKTTTRAWREVPAAIRVLPPLERVDALDTELRKLASAPSIDLGQLAMVCFEAGALFDRDFLDGAQFAAVTSLREAALAGDEAVLRRALRHGVYGPPPSPVLAPKDPVLLGHRAFIGAVAFSPDGGRLVSGDDDGLLLVHDCASGRELARVETGQSPRRGIGGLAWSPDGRSVASCEGTTLRLRDAQTWMVLAERASTVGTALAWGPRGAWLAITDSRGVNVVSGDTLADLARFRTEGDVVGAAVDPVLGRIAIIDGGATEETAMGAITSVGTPTVRLHTFGKDAPEGELWRGERVSTLTFDHSSRAFLVATAAGGLAWWSGGTSGLPAPRTPLRAMAVTERCVVVAPDAPVSEAQLELLDRDTFTRVATSSVPGGLAPSWILASPDGGWLATPGRPVEGRFGVRLWSVS